MEYQYQIHSKLDSIAHLYDAFILDQYGVMHNGKNALPHTTDCIAKLHSLGKKLIILSNTSAPSEWTLKRLPNFGFESRHFSGAVTSGDEASKYVRDNFKDNHKALLFIGENLPPALEFFRLCGDGIGLVSKKEIYDAHVIILHGSYSIVHSKDKEGVSAARADASATDTISIESFLKTGELEDDLKIMLQHYSSKKVPMICANSDFIVVHSDGSIRYMPGTIGKEYEKLGGQVIYFGKPYKAHFEACLDKLSTARHRVAHVGDSLQHDVKGANDSGIDSIFIASGVHALDLGVSISSSFGICDDITLEKDDLDKLFHKEDGIVPTHVLPRLKF